MHYLTKFCSFQSSGSPVHCLDKRYFISVFLTDVTGVDVSGLDSIGLNEFQILLILYLYESSGGGVIKGRFKDGILVRPSPTENKFLA